MSSTEAKAVSLDWAVSAWLLAAALVLASCPVPASATRYLVDASGGGDYSTIQAALDAHAVGPRDTILVQPGNYPESIVLPAEGPAACVVGASGAMNTILHTVIGPACEGYNCGEQNWLFRGLLFDEIVDRRVNRPSGAREGCQFRDCVFGGGFNAPYASVGPKNLSDCEFRAESWLMGCSAAAGFMGLRFVGAPLHLDAGAGRVDLRMCVFRGAADTLVFVTTSEYIFFHSCTFSDAGHAIVASGRECAIVADSCVFTNLTGDALRQVRVGWPPEDHSRPLGVQVRDSRFERCGSAVRWTPGTSAEVYMARDTILDCHGDGIVVSPWSYDTPSITGVRVVRSGGHGVVIDRTRSWAAPYIEDAVGIANCYFGDNHGDGLRVTSDLAPEVVFNSVLSNCVSERNGGAGFRIEDSNWRVRGNIAFHNGADGIAFTTHLPTGPTEEWYGSPDSILCNTSVANGGAGIAMGRADASGDFLQVVQHNLSMANIGVGLIRPLPPKGSVAFNDAWHNLGGDYWNLPAPLDSNLVSDAQLCDLPAGDLALAFGSPCGVGGVYGPIGALPEACAFPAGAPIVAAVQAFSMWPNPARGAVVFALPPSASGRLEVIDLLGRVRWRRDLQAGDTRVRWTGETGAGPLAPGLYWARLVAPSFKRSQRLVWIR